MNVRVETVPQQKVQFIRTNYMDYGMHKGKFISETGYPLVKDSYGVEDK